MNPTTQRRSRSARGRRCGLSPCLCPCWRARAALLRPRARSSVSVGCRCLQRVPRAWAVLPPSCSPLLRAAAGPPLPRGAVTIADEGGSTAPPAPPSGCGGPRWGRLAFPARAVAALALRLRLRALRALPRPPLAPARSRGPVGVPGAGATGNEGEEMMPAKAGIYVAARWTTGL